MNALLGAPWWVDGPQGRLRVVEGGGGGLPILLLHGLGSRLEVWSGQLPALWEERRAIAFDLRGMGESNRAANGDYSLDAMSDDVLAVANACRLDRFVLVGHSYAGAIVGTFAARHPERVAALVLADAAGDLRRLGEARVRQMREGLEADYLGEMEALYRTLLVHASDSVRDTVLAWMRETPQDVVLATLDGSLEYDPDAAFAHHREPRLSIAAADFDEPTALHYTIEGFELRIVQRVSHWLMMDKPDELTALLNEFVEPLDVGETQPEV